MLDARDAEDSRLLEQGRFPELLAKWEPTIVNRCVAALRGDDRAHDVAQEVMLRLYRELPNWERYRDTPYRVVVHNVIGWKVKEHFQRQRNDPPLPEEEEPSQWMSTSEDVAARDWMARFLDGLPEKERRVLELSLLGYASDEIARELAMTPNAVYQRLHHARKRFREALLDG